MTNRPDAADPQNRASIAAPVAAGQTAVLTMALIAISAGGGWVASGLGVPMPFMIGGLLVIAILLLLRPQCLPVGYVFPERVRRCFIALIGALIGATFTPALFATLGGVWLSFAAVVVFIGVAQTVNFALYFWIGGYDRPTAFYAAMPGGLVEAAILGEAAGGDARILTIQHFLRVTLTIITVPLLFLALSGETVGSGAGAALTEAVPRAGDIWVIVAIAAVGLLLGRYVRLPARQFVLPLLLSAGLHAGGVVETASPPWVIAAAQVVIGASLGARFSGITRHLLVRALGMGMLSVAAMLLLGALFAVLLSPVMGEPAAVIFISFAPGGMTEMSLIALSLAANPVFVSAHHLFRITTTVLISGQMARLFGVRPQG